MGSAPAGGHCQYLARQELPGARHRAQAGVMSSPSFTLNNGVQIPALGFGVFPPPPDETVTAVQTALEVGYRHIDTAAAYGHARAVGEPPRSPGVDRSEMFIETKIWITDYGYDTTLHAFDK